MAATAHVVQPENNGPFHLVDDGGGEYQDSTRIPRGGMGNQELGKPSQEVGKRENAEKLSETMKTAIVTGMMLATIEVFCLHELRRHDQVLGRGWETISR